MHIGNEAALSQYRSVKGIVMRKFVEKDSKGALLRDHCGNLKVILRETIKRIGEISKEELCLCPYCKTEMIAHRGLRVADHLEHKSSAAAISRGCFALTANDEEFFSHNSLLPY